MAGNLHNKDIEVAIDTGSSAAWLDQLHDACAIPKSATRERYGYGSYNVEAALPVPLELCDAAGKCVEVGQSDAYGHITAGCVDLSTIASDAITRWDVETIDHDGLVGLACGTSGCSAIGRGGVFVYDRCSRKVCLSDDPRGCDTLRSLQDPRDTTTGTFSTWETPVPVVDDMVIDTGRTNTTVADDAYGASCVVGIGDIAYLELDYRTNTARYRLNDVSVQTACSLAPSSSL